MLASGLWSLKKGVVKSLDQNLLLTTYVRPQVPIPQPSLKTTFSLELSLPQPVFQTASSPRITRRLHTIFLNLLPAFSVSPSYSLTRLRKV